MKLFEKRSLTGEKDTVREKLETDRDRDKDVDRQRQANRGIEIE